MGSRNRCLSAKYESKGGFPLPTVEEMMRQNVTFHVRAATG